MHIIFSIVFLIINAIVICTSIDIITWSGQIKLIVDIVIFGLDIALLVISVKNINKNKSISNQLEAYLKTVNITKIRDSHLRKLVSDCYIRKQPEDVDVVFSESEIHKLTDNGMQPIISNTMTALGVLGTFIGLILGLSSLGNTTDSIINGIDGLIPGMKTAFITSIVGLALSTSYNFFFRKEQVRLYTNINQIKPLIISEKIDIGNAKDLDGLSSVLQQFCEKSIQLVESIEKKAESAEQRVADAEKRLAESLNNFEHITTEKLKEYFNETVKINNKHIEDTVKTFGFIQEQMIKGIKEQHSEEMTKLIELYKEQDLSFDKQCSDFLNDLENKGTQLQADIKQEFSEGTTKLSDLFAINHKELEKWVGIIAQHQELLRESQKNIEEQQELLKVKQDAVNNNIDRLIESEENILSSMTTISKNIDEAYEKVSLAYKELNSATDKMKESDEKLVGTVGILDSTIQKLSENTTDLKDALDKSTNTVKTNLMTICETMNNSVEVCKTVSGTVEKQIVVVEETNKQIKENSETLKSNLTQIENINNTFKTNCDNFNRQLITRGNEMDISFRNSTDNLSTKLNNGLSDVIKQTGDRIAQMADTKTKQVSVDIEKIVEQEAKSIEEVHKLMEAIGSSLIKYASTVSSSKTESNKVLENIESSKLTADLLNKDLASISRYLEKIANIVEKLNKKADENVEDLL